MSTPNKIIGLSAPVAIEAKASKPATFEATIYTGGQLEVGGYDKPVVIDLAGLDRGNVLVANLDHDSSKRVGNFDVENDGRTLKAHGVASAATPARDEVVNSAKGGYVWQASVEVQPKKIQSVEAGENVNVNGQNFSGPVYVTRQGTLKGFAFVSHGADDSTTVSIAAKRNKKMQAPSFDAWFDDMGIDRSLMTQTQLAGLHANYEGRSDTNDADFAAVAPMIVASGDPVEAEQKRIRQIEAACRGEWNESAEQVTQLKAQAIGGDMSVDDLIQAMREIRMNQAMSQIPYAPPVRNSRRDVNPQIIEAAFCLQAGIEKPEKHFPEQVLEAAYPQRNNVSMGQLIMAEAVRNGYTARPGESIGQGNLRSVLAHAFPPIHGGGFSTINLPNTFANISNKFVRDGWDSVDQTALRICYIRSVKDFKQITTISLTGGLVFEQLSAGGQIKHGELGEEVYHNQAATYARMFAITRTDLINDDSDILSKVPRRIGRGSMLKLNKLVWTAFLNNDSFFTDARNNLVDADGLTLGTIALAETAFINQTDPDGEPLGIVPAILLVPPTLKSNALTLMNSQLTVAGNTTGAMPNANVWQGRFSVESSPYMENTNYTGNSSSAFYLLASPQQLPVIEIAALNGNVMPTVESADADFDQLGIQCRGYSDVGVAMQEYRGGVKAENAET